MNEKEIKLELEKIQKEVNDFEDVLNLSEKEKRIKELEEESNKENFWNNVDKSSQIMEELSSLKKEKEDFLNLKDKISLTIEFCELEDINLGELEEEFKSIQNQVEEFRKKLLLNKEFDRNNAYLEIHSGAGGTESNDWANMIFNMYKKYCDTHSYKYEIVSIQNGEEVGIKGCLMFIKGLYAFGMLKGETGVHRLVRISPFDSNKRRHTSFASVLVTPEIDKNIEVEIKENDLKIDVFKSSGAGGQSVNTTDSAVRITHLPTGIVVSVQNERSQLKNKEKALEILKGKLYLIEKEKFNDKLKDLKGEVMDVNFGSAIRSYVMCPYTLVKDVRTNVENSNVEKVLNGDLDMFIDGYLKK